MDPKEGTITITGDFQNAEVAFVRKRDKQLMNVKAISLLQHFKTADFINNEITINGEACILNSLQAKYEPLELTVAIVSNVGNGTYQVGGVTYETGHVFTVNKGTAVSITLIPTVDSEVESVVDNLGQPYAPVNNVVSVTVNAALTLTITFKAKVI